MAHKQIERKLIQYFALKLILIQSNTPIASTSSRKDSTNFAAAFVGLKIFVELNVIQILSKCSDLRLLRVKFEKIFRKIERSPWEYLVERLNLHGAEVTFVRGNHKTNLP